MNNLLLLYFVTWHGLRHLYLIYYGASRPNNLEQLADQVENVLILCYYKRQVRIFLDSAETIYRFPIALNPNFKFFLKSMNLKELEISSITAI